MMEKVMANGFEELSCEEANVIEGGNPAAPVAVVGVIAGAWVAVATAGYFIGKGIYYATH